MKGFLMLFILVGLGDTQFHDGLKDNSSDLPSVKCSSLKSECTISQLTNEVLDIKKILPKLKLKRIKTLTFDKSVLWEFPRDLITQPSTIEELFIDNLGLQQLTLFDLKFFPSLKVLVASDNNIESLPQELFDETPNIKMLDFHDNRLSQIDMGSLLALKNLRDLDLTGNVCVDEKYDFRDERQMTKASNAIIQSCFPDNYQLQVGHRRCLLTVALITSAMSGGGGKKSKKCKKKCKKGKCHWKNCPPPTPPPPAPTPPAPAPPVPAPPVPRPASPAPRPVPTPPPKKLLRPPSKPGLTPRPRKTPPRETQPETTTTPTTTTTTRTTTTTTQKPTTSTTKLSTTTKSNTPERPPSVSEVPRQPREHESKPPAKKQCKKRIKPSEEEFKPPKKKSCKKRRIKCKRRPKRPTKKCKKQRKYEVFNDDLSDDNLSNQNDERNDDLNNFT